MRDLTNIWIMSTCGLVTLFVFYWVLCPKNSKQLKIACVRFYFDSMSWLLLAAASHRWTEPDEMLCETVSIYIGSSIDKFVFLFSTSISIPRMCVVYIKTECQIQIQNWNNTPHSAYIHKHTHTRANPIQSDVYSVLTEFKSNNIIIHTYLPPLNAVAP